MGCLTKSCGTDEGLKSRIKTALVQYEKMYQGEPTVPGEIGDELARLLDEALFVLKLPNETRGK